MCDCQIPKGFALVEQNALSELARDHIRAMRTIEALLKLVAKLADKKAGRGR